MSDYWSDCGQVYFLDGWAWGLTKKCQRICLGTEEDVKKFLETGEKPPSMPPILNEAFDFIKEYRNERETDVRSGPTRVVEHKQSNPKLSEKGKRTPLYKTHKKR